MFSSGCLELSIVAAALVGMITFVITYAIGLHTGTMLLPSIEKGFFNALISFGSTALLLTLAFTAIRYFSGKIEKRKH